MRYVPRLTTIGLSLLLLPSLVGCATNAPAITSTPPPATTPAAAAGRQLPASPHCPGLVSTVDVAPKIFGRAAGASPVWAIFGKDQAIIDLNAYAFAERTEHGTTVKLLWVVENMYRGPVRISGASVAGTPLWFRIGDQQPASQPTLQSQAPPVPVQHPGFVDFPGDIFLPGPGCYTLHAETTNEHWSIVFEAIQ